MNPARPALHHIALTVTDLDASAAWYEAVFAIAFRIDIPHPGGVGRVLTDDAGTLAFVLHRHDRNERERFSETRTGLDHVGLAVGSRDDLEAWQVHLEDHGVQRTTAAAGR
jgi:glyoxylase I family protein